VAQKRCHTQSQSTCLRFFLLFRISLRASLFGFDFLFDPSVGFRKNSKKMAESQPTTLAEVISSSHYNDGRALVNNGDYDAAITHFEQLLKKT
jgi:outer membrane protein assembly factor BamD (BamD/ComL family)